MLLEDLKFFACLKLDFRGSQLRQNEGAFAVGKVEENRGKAEEKGEENREQRE